MGFLHYLLALLLQFQVCSLFPYLDLMITSMIMCTAKSSWAVIWRSNHYYEIKIYLHPLLYSVDSAFACRANPPLHVEHLWAILLQTSSLWRFLRLFPLAQVGRPFYNVKLRDLRHIYITGMCFWIYSFYLNLSYLNVYCNWHIDENVSNYLPWSWNICCTALPFHHIRIVPQWLFLYKNHRICIEAHIYDAFGLYLHFYMVL